VIANCEHYQGQCLTFLVCPVDEERRCSIEEENDFHRMVAELEAECAMSGLSLAES